MIKYDIIKLLFIFVFYFYLVGIQSEQMAVDQ